MTLSYITFPLMFLLLLCAKPIFILLYTERWISSVPYFQVLCIAGLAYSLQSVNYQSIAAIGKSKVMFEWTFVKRVVGLLLVVCGLLLYGMKGLLIGMVCNTWFSYFVNIGLVSKYVGYKWQSQLRDLAPILLVSTTIALFCYGVGRLLQQSLYIDCCIKLCLYVLCYLGWSMAFKPEAYHYFQSITISTFNKRKKNKR